MGLSGYKPLINKRLGLLSTLMSTYLKSDLSNLISFWRLARIFTLGGYLYDWLIDAKDAWIVKGILFNSKYDENTEKLIYSWWEKRAGNCVIKGDEVLALLEQLDNDILITTHWLLYIFDLQVPANRVWENFGVFYNIVKKCKEGGYEVFEREGELYRSEGLKKILVSNGIEFKHRFMTSESHNLFERLGYTLKRLESFDCSLVTYLSELFERCEPENHEWIRFMAFSLNYLTYREIEKLDKESSMNKERYIEEVVNQYNSVKYRENWIYRTGKLGKITRIRVPGTKRLWAALRDYVLNPFYQRLIYRSPNVTNPLKDFYEYILLPDNLLKNEYYLEQLEMPGDLWNKRFIEKIGKLFPGKGVVLKSNARDSARRIYFYLKSLPALGEQIQMHRLYPVYLDYTFGMSPKVMDVLLKHSKDFFEHVTGSDDPDGIMEQYEKARCFFQVYL